MTTLNFCPICSNASFSNYIECVDYTVSREKFHIVRCVNCCFLFTNPRPDAEQLGKYYESEDYISHSNSKKGLINTIYQFVRNRSIKSKVDLIESFNFLEKSIADIGCGTGEFLSAMKKAGWSTRGFEPSDRAKDFGINTYGLNISSPEEFLNLNSRLFSVVTMWHVLEHINQLGDYAITLNKILKDDGILIIAVPNAEAFEAKIYKEYWAAFDVPRHLNHFTSKSISDLFVKFGFKINKTIPMPYDSFYISMLSEKYKGSSIIKIIFNMFINGLRSNFAARKNKSKASSLIFILRKIKQGELN